VTRNKEKRKERRKTDRPSAVAAAAVASALFRAKTLIIGGGEKNELLFLRLLLQYKPTPIASFFYISLYLFRLFFLCLLQHTQTHLADGWPGAMLPDICVICGVCVCVCACAEG